MESAEHSTIYDHYKETADLVARASNRRDRLMLWVLIALTLFSFEMFFPTPAAQVIGALLAERYGVAVPVDFAIVGNVIWLGLLLFSLRYFQSVAYVERQYPYLHRLEDQLNASLGKELITREGKSYLADYPNFQEWLSFLYRVAFPTLLLAMSTIKIVVEWWAGGGSWPCAPLLVNSVVYALLAISTSLYLSMLHLSPRGSKQTRR